MFEIKKLLLLSHSHLTCILSKLSRTKDFPFNTELYGKTRYLEKPPLFRRPKNTHKHQEDLL